MDEVDRSSIVRSAMLFRGLSPFDLDDLSRRLVDRAYRRGDIIFRRGDAAGALHFVHTGSVKVTLTTEDGKETLLALLGAGNCFGEIAALDGGGRSATVTAAEPTTTLALLRDDLLAFIPAASVWTVASSHPRDALRTT